MSYMFKIINSGDGGVGKTTFLKRYTTGIYLENSKETIGTGFFTKTLLYNGDQDKVILSIWDLGGQERFRYFLKDFTYGATAALLFFDLSRYDTFLHIDDWIKLLRSKEQKTINLPILLIGSKFDLKDNIAVKQEEISDIVEKYDLAGFYPTSSKEQINVDESMNALVEYIFEINEDFIQT